MKAKLGIAPIAWWNDDLAELSDDVSLEECLRQASVAGFTGMETGRRFPMDMAELGPILKKYGISVCGGWFSGLLLDGDIEVEKDRVAAHAGSVLAVVGLIFAAGIFTGILSGTGMVDAMSKSLLAVIPDAMGPYLAVITAIVSMPFTFFMSNDAFYYGVLPVLAEAASHYGISPVEMARASIVGQPVHLLSPLVPSTYLLVALAGIEFGDHQRFTLKWAVLVCLCIMLAALLMGIFPLFSSL